MDACLDPLRATIQRITTDTMTDLPESPAAERNKQAILDVLRRLLPARGRALELASGTGQHVACFSAGLPGWTWQPSEANSAALPTISAWVQRAGVAGVHPPLLLDVTTPAWLDGPSPATEVLSEPFDAIFCANLLHVAPWSVCPALMQGARHHLAAGAPLMLYGPFLEGDVPTAPGNLDFDASLRRQDPAWGIRSREAVERCALDAGLRLRQRMPMPTNNLMLVFEAA